ncbi:unnamed protein product [Polarella glacialis]|uniref:C2 domain-containing protein n=1 Tax=Polarella glacialis TaxID=89957 RepID=A0A813HGH6_POLGL|nr:unnamed protein product [Polarella glacialis]
MFRCVIALHVAHVRKYQDQERWSHEFHLVDTDGGTYGSVVTGEVLIGFELLHSKFRAELPAMKMWPAYPDEYSPKEHFAKLRKATLHFSLYGLRDLVPTSAGAGDPIVCVKVKKWWQTERDEPKYYQVFFNYKELVEGSDGDNKDDNLHKWRSDALGQVGCRNYEFFQVRRLQIMLPDKAILQPFVTVRVYEKPTEVFGYKMFGDEGALVGESRQPLNKLYPCCWYDGVDLNLNYEYQERKIRAGVTRALLDCEARKSFVEETQEERDRVMEQTRETRRKEQIEVMKSLISMEEEKAEKIDSLALPMELRAYKRIHNEAGYQPQQRERLQLREEHRLNMELMQNFPTRYGEKLSNSAEGTGGPRVSSKLENSRKNVFVPDFWFQNAPLLRNSDIVRLDDDLMDWNFQFGKVHGFVKCAFKLTDDWDPRDTLEEKKTIAEQSVGAGIEALADASGVPALEAAAVEALAVIAVDLAAKTAADELVAKAKAKAKSKSKSKVVEEVAPTALAVVAAKNETEEDCANKGASERCAYLMRQSYLFDEELDTYAFDVTKLTQKFKNKEKVPSRIRVRIYFVKAICIFGKQVEGLFAKAFVDPYLAYKLGTNILVSMRNMAQFNTNVPTFYRVEERDIAMPSEARLQVDLFDYQDAFGETILGEKLIGSSVIDLEATDGIPKTGDTARTLVGLL